MLALVGFIRQCSNLFHPIVTTTRWGPSMGHSALFRVLLHYGESDCLCALDMQQLDVLGDPSSIGYTHPQRPRFITVQGGHCKPAASPTDHTRANEAIDQIWDEQAPCLDI
jgi:hypothetical protein